MDKTVNLIPVFENDYIRTAIKNESSSVSELIFKQETNNIRELRIELLRNSNAVVLACASRSNLNDIKELGKFIKERNIKAIAVCDDVSLNIEIINLGYAAVVLYNKNSFGLEQKTLIKKIYSKVIDLEKANGTSKQPEKSVPSYTSSTPKRESGNDTKSYFEVNRNTENSSNSNVIRMNTVSSRRIDFGNRNSLSNSSKIINDSNERSTIDTGEIRTFNSNNSRIINGRSERSAIAVPNSTIDAGEIRTLSSNNGRIINGRSERSAIAVPNSTIDTDERRTLSSRTGFSVTAGNAVHNFSGRTHSVINYEEDSVIETLIVMGASTGGTEALLEVLKKLPEKVPPILIVQHMPVGFTKMYADRCDYICKIKVHEAAESMAVKNGNAYIAPGGQHMRVRKSGNNYFITCQKGEKVNGVCPAADVLFDSVVENMPKKTVGVILTGMGVDGAAGLLKLRNKGAYTIGQNEKTCVVYGMPKEAYERGAVKVQADIKDIAEIILENV